MTECPRCKSVKIVSGSYPNESGSCFAPKGLRIWKFVWSGTPVNKLFEACTDCGLFWSQVDQRELLKILQTAGTDKIKKQLGL